MCRNMVDIQSATTEITRGKKRRNKPQGKNIMSASATQGSHNKFLKASQTVTVIAVKQQTSLWQDSVWNIEMSLPAVMWETGIECNSAWQFL